jgi:hypothetical protein
MLLRTTRSSTERMSEKGDAIENYAFFHGEDVREKECY